MALELYPAADAATLRILLRRTLNLALDLTWGEYADEHEHTGRVGNDGTY